MPPFNPNIPITKFHFFSSKKVECKFFVDIPAIVRGYAIVSTKKLIPISGNRQCQVGLIWVVLADSTPFEVRTKHHFFVLFECQTCLFQKVFKISIPWIFFENLRTSAELIDFKYISRIGIIDSFTISVS